MSNKKAKRVPVNKEHFIEQVDRLGYSIRKLGSGEAYEVIQRDEKTIRRYLNEGAMPPDLLEKIAMYLNVHPDFLSGRLHEEAAKIKDEYLRGLREKHLTAEHFPYIIRARSGIEYTKYFEDILTMNNITMEHFNTLPQEERVLFRQELAVAIFRVIAKHFPVDSLGNDTFDILQYHEAFENDVDPYSFFAMLEGYDEPEPEFGPEYCPEDY